MMEVNGDLLREFPKNFPNFGCGLIYRAANIYGFRTDFVSCSAGLIASHTDQGE